MSRVIVSDSTCLIGLERISQLEVLAALFDEIFAPPAVAREFGMPLPWLKVREPSDLAHVAALKLLVDEGEAEAIALAKELGCEVILDDLQARPAGGKAKYSMCGSARDTVAGEVCRLTEGDSPFGGRIAARKILF